MKKQVLICGNYGASNLGDEAILQGIWELLSAAYHLDYEVAVLSSDPMDTHKLHGVSSYFLVPAGLRSFFRNVKNGELKKTLKKIKSSDLFILGGGGLFTDEKFHAIIIWFLQVFVARVYRKKILMMGQSVGPLKGRIARWLTKVAFSWSEKIIVRDEISAQLLRNLGLPDSVSKEMTVLPDPAFFLRKALSSSSISETESAQPYVVLSLRPWIDGNDLKRAKVLAEIIDWFEQEYQMRTVLLPMQWQQDDDFMLLKQVAQLCKIAKATEVISRAYQLPQILSHLQKAELVVGMRLHSLILSALVSTPMVALCYSDKVDGVMTMLEMSDQVIPLDEVSVSVLKQKIDDVLKSKLSLRSHLQKKMKSFQQEKNKYIQILQSIC